MLNSYFGKYLGGDSLGLMRLFTQLVAYLNLAELGLASVSAYSLYKPLVRKDTEKINIVMSTLSEIYRYVFIGVLVFGLILAFVLPFLIDNTESILYVELYWALYVVSTAATYLYAKYQILFTANQEFDFVRIVQGLSKITVQSIQIFTIIYYQSFLIFSLILIFDAIIQYCFFKYHFNKNYKNIKKVNGRDKSIITGMKNLAWHKVGSLIIFNTDYIIISYFFDLKTVAIYASYMMVIQIIKTIFNVFFSVLNPRIGKFIAKNEMDFSYKIYRMLNVLFFILAVSVSSSVYLSVNSFVILWMDESYILSNSVIALLSINLFIDLSRNITGVFKINSGFFEDVHLPKIESVLNLSMSLILVNYLGLSGIVMGTVISNVVVVLFWGPSLVFSVCFQQDKITYLKYIAKKILLALPIVVGLILSDNFIEATSWYEWLKESLYGFIILLSISILIFVLDGDFRALIKERKSIYKL